MFYSLAFSFGDTQCGNVWGWSIILHHSECHCGIEQSTTYSIENPGSNSEGKAKGKADEEKLVDCRRSIGIYRV